MLFSPKISESKWLIIYEILGSKWPYMNLRFITDVVIVQ